MLAGPGTVVNLSVGVLADSALQQHSLRSVINACGCTVVANLLLEQLQGGGAPLPQAVDAWVIDVDMAGDKAHQLDQWLDQIDVPVIFGDGAAHNPGGEAFADWSRRLTEKVQQLAGAINLQQSCEPGVRGVWVLAASTGGPEAVKEFLNRLPPDLGLSFIYVQHIDTDFDKTLAQVMSKGSHYPAAVVKHGDLLTQNRVAIIASDACVEVLENGTMAIRQGGWRGPFKPSIDQVVANVARTYGSQAGVIIFSGMGDDGASSCRLITQQGGTVWAQSPETCACSSMPDAALATETVAYTGSPAELAVKMQQHIKRQIPITIYGV